MDIVALRKKYGRRLAMKGGIDKHVLRQDKSAIRAELEYKLQPLMREGGMVFGLDHRIVNGTPIEKRFRKLLNDSKIDGTVQIENAVKESKIESEKKVKKQKAEAKADAKTDSEK